MKILKRLCEYWRDKKLAEKCGFPLPEICTHENDESLYSHNEKAKYISELMLKCIKCGEFYR